MKRGELINLFWQYSVMGSSNIHIGIVYEVDKDKKLYINDLRSLWEWMNEDIADEFITCMKCVSERKSE